MSKSEFTRKAQQLQVFFSEMADTFGRETGFVQRKSKMTGACFVQTLVLGWLDNPEASLNQLVQVSADLGVEISVPGLQQRLNPSAVRFLKALLQQALGWFRERVRLPEEVLRHFSAVNIVDSSLFELPAALREDFPGTKVNTKPAELKLQLSFDYLSGNLNALELLAGRIPDQNSLLPTTWAKDDSLTLFDLGFFKKSRFEDIAKVGGYFVSRLLTQTGVYSQATDRLPLDLLTVLSASSAGSGEMRVYLHAQHPIEVRLVYSRLPEGVVAERRCKAKANARRRGETCSARHLELLAWSLFITNVPSDWLSLEQVVLLYRVRWQIELVFKLWKSHAKLDGIGDWSLERVMCQFYGRLLGLIIFHWSVAPYHCLPLTDLSFPKAFRIVQRHALRWVDAIANHWRGVAAIIANIMEDFQRFALKNQPRKSPSTYQLLVSSGA